MAAPWLSNCERNKETTIYLRDVSIRVGLRETTTVEPPKERFGSQIHTATGKLSLKKTLPAFSPGSAPLLTK